MNTLSIVDLIFASLMGMGGGYGLVKMGTYCSGYFPKELTLAVINQAWKNLIKLGWNSQYHLMFFWNLASLAAIIHWHLWMSGTVIALLYVATGTLLLVLKARIIRSADVLTD